MSTSMGMGVVLGLTSMFSSSVQEVVQLPGNGARGSETDVLDAVALEGCLNRPLMQAPTNSSTRR